MFDDEAKRSVYPLALTGMGPHPYRMVGNRGYRGRELAEALQTLPPSPLHSPHNLPSPTILHMGLNKYLSSIKHALQTNNKNLLERLIPDTQRYIDELKPQGINIDEQLLMFEDFVNKARAARLYGQPFMPAQPPLPPLVDQKRERAPARSSSPTLEEAPPLRSSDRRPLPPHFLGNIVS